MFRFIGSLVVSVLFFAGLTVTGTASYASDAFVGPRREISPAALSQFSSAPKPVILGTANVGNTLEVQVGNWVPAFEEMTYDWKVGGVSKGSSSTYLIGASDRGVSITVSVTAKRAGYQNKTQTSSPVTATGLISAGGDVTIVSSVYQGDKVTAVVPTFTPTPSQVSYQWYRGSSAIPGANASSYTASASDLNKNLSVQVTAKLASYDDKTLTSNQSNPVILHDFEVTDGVTIATELFVGDSVTAVLPSISPSATLAYQWYRDGIKITNATARSYTVATADAAHALTVKVTLTKTNYAKLEMTSNSSSTVLLHAFEVAGDVTIPTVIHQGDSVTASLPNFNPVPSSTSYQWYRDGSPIGGATSVTYVAKPADVGAGLSVKVTVAKATYENTVLESNASDPVALYSFSTTFAPQLSSTSPAVGDVLSSTTSLWTPRATFSYQWFQDSSPISGATKATYTVVAADLGHTLSLKLTGSKINYESVIFQTDSTEEVVRGTLSARSNPTISGSTVTGSTLSANAGTWTPSSTQLKYQWKRNGANIGSATQQTYLLGANDVGARISVAVTGTLAGYSPLTLTSSQTTSISGVFGGTPVGSISGNLENESTLRAVVSGLSPAPTGGSYQWYRDGSPISGARASTYRLTPADASHDITFTGTVTRSGYAGKSVSSSAVRWTVQQYTVTYSAWDLYNMCVNAGGSFEPCDYSNGKFWGYSDGSGDTVMGFLPTLPKTPTQWYLVFADTEGNPGYPWVVISTNSNSQSDQGNMTFYPTWTSSSYGTGWKYLHDGRQLLIGLGSDYYCSVYIGSMTITYYA